MNQVVSLSSNSDSDMSEISKYVPASEAIQKSREVDQKLFSMPEWQASYNRLGSEEVADNEPYKKAIPEIKGKFKELFGFEPRITNSFILTLHEFIENHAKLKDNMQDSNVKLLAEYSRNEIENWIISEYSHFYYKPSYGAENLKETEARISKEVTEERLNNLYGWIFNTVQK